MLAHDAVRLLKQTVHGPTKYGPVSVLLLCVLSAVSGCGQNPPGYAADLVAVWGQVTIDDKPISGAVVTFLADQGPSRSSSAVTDSEGLYSMATPPAGEGVLPGRYSVVINQFAMPDGSPPPPDVAPIDVGAVEQLPEQFSSFANPTLSADVSEAGGAIDFKLILPQS